jgi:hypothetical protein
VSTPSSRLPVVLRAAMEREEALPAVAKVVELMEAGALAGPPEWTVFDVASSESPRM